MKTLILSKKNLMHNLSVIKSKTKAKICAVVKANAYGHGVREICEILKNKVEFFAVANISEAMEIRAFDRTTKILIMGKCDDYVLAAKNNISVTIFSKTELQNLKKKLSKINKINIHLKVNSGMNRIGFSKTEDFANAITLISKLPSIHLEGVFTHFSTLRNDIDYFRKQQKIFDDFIHLVPKDTKPIIHGGGSFTCLFSNDYDMIRCGIFLYGYGIKPLKPVMSVYADILQTNDITKNSFVGYSKSFIADKDMHIGVIGVGYHDGVPRNFIGQELFFGKESVKILSVCMDMIILELPEKAKLKSKIKVFDNAAKWANILKTNEHDILVSFSSFRGDRMVR